MIGFALSDDQQRLRALAHEFAATEIRPCALAHDRDGSWPGNVAERMWDAGLLNASLPSEYGGPGLGNLDAVLIGEEISWGCTAFSTIIGANALAIGAVTLGGSEALKRRYLARLGEAPRFASFALTEPNVGSDVSGLATRATRERGGWRIRGEKTFISSASHADWYVVFARTDAPRIEITDTTGAGDAFAGTLAASLAEGRGRDRAVRRAIQAGSLACTRLGVIPALPTRAQLERVVSETIAE